MQSYDTRYKISHNDLAYGRKLGEGGFGEVFEGTWQHSQVAIKKLKMQKLSPEAYQKLETEAKMMAELRHDNIVGFRGFCFESPNYALVMEYMPRGSLYDLLHSSQEIDWQTRIQISIGAGAGLVYLHNKNILHRDIKSLNVLLYMKEHELHAKLTDFGLSKLKTDTKLTTSTSKGSSGTLAWMAPELFARRAKYEKATDVYSFAVMLWEIASRRVPFEDAHDPGLIPGWVKDGEREEIPEGTPELLKEAIQAGWKQETKDRHTAEQIVSSLKFLLQSLPRPTQTSASPNPNPNPHPQPLSGLQGNYASGGIKQPIQPTLKQPKAPYSFQGNLASQMPAVPTRPEKLNPQSAPVYQAHLSGIANNLQTVHVPSLKLPTKAELKVAQQQAEHESLKNSMDALLKMKEQEKAKKKREEEKEKQEKRHVEEVTRLLNVTAHSNLYDVKQYLQRNPELVYAQGDITDPAGRTFKNITAFQYAVWALDKHMWELILTVLPQVNANDQLHVLEHEREDIIQTHGAHFSFDSLLNANQTYLDNWKKWWKNNQWDDMEYCWYKEVEKAQFQIPNSCFKYFTNKKTGEGMIINMHRRFPDSQISWSDIRPCKINYRDIVPTSYPPYTHPWIPTGKQLLKKFEREFENDQKLLTNAKSVCARGLAELRNQLSQATVNPSSSLRLSKQ